MFTVATMLFILASEGEAKKIALVLSSEGAVTLQSATGTKRPARVMDLLAEGDQLATGADSKAIVIFFSDNHREQIKPSVEATLSAKGCAPASSVIRREAVTTTVSYAGVRRFSGTGRAALVTLRGDDLPAESPIITPLYGSTVLTDRPTLTWKAAPCVQEYEVRLTQGRFDKTGPKASTVWTVRSKEARLRYPEREQPLLRGEVYRWSVTTRPGQKDNEVVCEGQFVVATQAKLEALAGVKPLAVKNDPADLFLAALTYQEHLVFDEALPLFEKLAKLLPEESCFQLALADYYERAGRRDLSEHALARAKKLLAKAASR